LEVKGPLLERNAPHSASAVQPEAAPPAVVVDGLGKTFHVPQQRYTRLRERLVDRFRPEPPEILRALHGVSFEVRRGEFFGVAGRNGSGKSTLLRCVAGIYDYEEGRIEVSGRLAPFVELGVDLRPELSARDNVILNATMLGLSRAQAHERLDEILAFAGLEEFGAMKLRNFSSGMKVRLAFSVAIQVDADILLVDEVLSVGDSSFQRRCFEEFDRLKSEGRTVVLVTHDMDALRQCDRAVLLESQQVVAVGDPARIATRYEELNLRNFGPRELSGEGPVLGISTDAPSEEEGFPVVGPSPTAQPFRPGGTATYRPAAVGDDLGRLATVTSALAITEFRMKYLDSALGYVWAVMRPLLFFLVLYAVFDNIANLGSGVEHYGIYVLAAVIMWTFFAETVTGSVTCLATSEGLLRKLRFPQLAIPLSVSARALLNFGVNSLVVLAFVVASGLGPRWSWLELPLLAALLALLAIGLGTLLSVLYVRYRDTYEVWGLAQQLLFFGSPIIYTAGRYPEQAQEVLSLSPLAAIFTQMRHALIDPSAPTAAESVGGTAMLLVPLGIVFGFLALGLWLFSREAPRVAERL
jgi:ABC-type polysaccharide/polyol phosphate transport system ATPase subunit/ABC-type polysaccharide/polyol phosphate export permease